jgi:hypothetical protein
MILSVAGRTGDSSLPVDGASRHGARPVFGAGHALIRGLREGGSETELTRAFAAVLDAEPEMAAEFLQLILRRAPHGDAIHDVLPSRFSCVAEEKVEQGRADLTFRDRASGWHVIVEIKIYAGYGDRQIERYLASLDEPRGFVVAVTRNVPYGDPDVGDDRWVGSVRWAELLGGLRALRPKNEDLARQWPLFLDVLEQEGSMGFTKPDMGLFEAWAKFPIARDHMIDFVASIQHALLDALRLALADAEYTAAPDQPLATLARRGKRKDNTVAPRLGKVSVNFHVLGSKEPRVRVGMWGWGEPNFTVEVPYPAADVPHEDRDRSLAVLRAGNFENWQERDQVLWRHLRIDDALVRSGELETRVLTFARSSFESIARSGIFDLKAAAVPEEDDEDQA